MAAIKCVKCGSSAQVKLSGVEKNFRTNQLTYYYKCGCGCEFKISVIEKIEIIKE